jgi:hypothetical protein
VRRLASVGALVVASLVAGLLVDACTPQQRAVGADVAQWAHTAACCMAHAKAAPEEIKEICGASEVAAPIVDAILSADAGPP